MIGVTPMPLRLDEQYQNNTLFAFTLRGAERDHTLRYGARR